MKGINIRREMQMCVRMLVANGSAKPESHYDSEKHRNAWTMSVKSPRFGLVKVESQTCRCLTLAQQQEQMARN